MTEAEYVKTLQAAALDYLDFIREPSDKNVCKAQRWWELRDHLSTQTFLSLCDAWLARPTPITTEGGGENG